MSMLYTCEVGKPMAELGEWRRAAPPVPSPGGTRLQSLPSHVRFNESKGPFMEHSYSSSLTRIPADDLRAHLGLHPRTFSGRLPSRVGQRLTSLVTRNSERPRTCSQSRWPGTPTRLWS